MRASFASVLLVSIAACGGATSDGLGDGSGGSAGSSAAGTAGSSAAGSSGSGTAGSGTAGSGTAGSGTAAAAGTGPAGTGAGAQAGTGTAGGSGSGTAGGSGTGMGGGSGTSTMPPSCDDLLRDVFDALDDAKVCCPECDIEQCTAVVEGPCCLETVQAEGAPATKAYLDAFSRLQSSNCGIACPAIPCPEPEFGECKRAPNGGGGRCR